MFVIFLENGLALSQNAGVSNCTHFTYLAANIDPSLHGEHVTVNILMSVLLSLGIDCGSLNEPKNGFLLLSGTAEGDTATYSCKPGFVLTPGGGNTRICNHSGKWTGLVPECRSNSCNTSFSKH